MHLRINLLEGVFEFEGESQQLELLLPLFQQIGKSLKKINDNASDIEINKLKQLETEITNLVNRSQTRVTSERHLGYSYSSKQKPNKSYLLLFQEVVSLLSPNDLEEIKTMLVFYFFQKTFPGEIPLHEQLIKIASDVGVVYQGEPSSLNYLLKRNWLRTDKQGHILISTRGKQMLESILEEELQKGKKSVEKLIPNTNW
jgi:hypothetical protein